jgi:hypothetical protein
MFHAADISLDGGDWSRLVLIPVLASTGSHFGLGQWRRRSYKNESYSRIAKNDHSLYVGESSKMCRFIITEVEASFLQDEILVGFVINRDLNMPKVETEYDDGYNFRWKLLP